MNKAEYQDIRKKLCFSRSTGVTLAILIADAVLAGFSLYLLTFENIWSYVISQIFLAIFFFHNFGILHEAVHGNLCKERWLNTVFGHYASIFCFTPYFPWRHMHQRHHTWAGSLNKDPTMRILEKLKGMGKIPIMYAIAWRAWIPLPAIMQHIIFWGYPLRVIREAKADKKFILQSLFSCVFIISVYASFFYFFPLWMTIKNFGLAIFLYFLLTEIINLPHHTKVPVFYSNPAMDKLHPWEQHVTTRSCKYPGILSELIALNFNLHVEHHYFPNLPWYRLKKLRDILKPMLGNEYMETSDFGWNIRNRAISATEAILPDVPHPLLQPHMR